MRTTTSLLSACICSASFLSLHTISCKAVTTTFNAFAKTPNSIQEHYVITLTSSSSHLNRIEYYCYRTQDSKDPIATVDSNLDVQGPGDFEFPILGLPIPNVPPGVFTCRAVCDGHTPTGRWNAGSREVEVTIDPSVFLQKKHAKMLAKLKQYPSSKKIRSQNYSG